MFTFDFIIQIISLIGIVSVFGFKYFETKSGQPGVLTKASVGFDPKISHVVHKGKQVLVRVQKIPVGAAVNTGTNYVFNIFGTVGLFLSKYHKQFKNNERSISKKGVVSFFLKDVAESRAEGEKKL